MNVLQKKFSKIVAFVIKTYIFILALFAFNALVPGTTIILLCCLVSVYLPHLLSANTGKRLPPFLSLVVFLLFVLQVQALPVLVRKRMRSGANSNNSKKRILFMTLDSIFSST